MKDEGTIDLPSLKDDASSFADNCFKRVEVAEGSTPDTVISV